MSQEHDLNDGLKDEEVSRLYAEAAQLEPPGHLDAAILAEARRAVSARPAAMPKRRWAVPLGLVASVLVMVMVGLQLPYMLEEPATMQAPQAAGIASQMEEAAPAPPATAMAPAPVPAAKAKAMPEREERARMDALGSEKRSSFSSEGNVAPALKPQAPAAAVAAPAPVLLERALMKDESIEASPEDWLKRIEQLKRDGKQEEVRKELEAFRKRYPDHPIPAGLR